MSHPVPEPSPSLTQPAEGTQVELRWPDSVGADAQAVNQVLVSWDQDSTDLMYLYLGHVAPPPWLTEEIASERLDALHRRLEVTPKGAFVLSRTRAEELWSAIGRHLGKLPPL